MKRRGILKMIGLAPFAAPAAARGAMSATMGDLALEPLGLAAADSYAPSAPATAGHADWVKRLAVLAARTPEQHAFLTRRMGVYHLDADLAAMRSLSLDWRIREQRKRNYARSLEEDKGWLHARIAGWLD